MKFPRSNFTYLQNFTSNTENMKAVILSGHHLLLTDAIKSLTTDKFQKLFRHEPSILKARVELISERDHSNNMTFIAKGHLDIEGPNLVAAASSNDLYKSIDLLVRKLDGQLRRRHGVQHAKRKDALAA